MVIFNKFKLPMLKILALVSFIFIAGCASTAQQIGTNKYTTDCSGMFSGKSDCYNEASRVCNGNFTEINFRIDDRGDVWDDFCQCYVWVIKRNLTFGCR